MKAYVIIDGKGDVIGVYLDKEQAEKECYNAPVYIVETDLLGV